VVDIDEALLLWPSIFLREKERKLTKSGRKVAIEAAVIPIAGSAMDHLTRLMPNQE
jgi:hypothetical protein